MYKHLNLDAIFASLIISSNSPIPSEYVLLVLRLDPFRLNLAS